MTNAEKFLKDGVDLEEFSKSIMTWYFGNYAKANDFARIKNWAEHKIETLTEDERVILRNIKGYATIIRNIEGNVQVENKGGSFACMCAYNHLFQFIEVRRKISNRRTIGRRIIMSLYNSLFGVNANSNEILSLIGLKEDFFARFRDVDLINNGEIVRVFTRTGGGNREYYEDSWQEIRKSSNYITDYDDDFDETYAYIEFKVPADKLEKAKALFTGELESFEEKFNKSMEDMNNPDSKSYKVAENIAKQISNGIDSGEKGGIIFI